MAQRGPESVTLVAQLPALGKLPALAPLSEAVIEVSSPSPERSILHMRTYAGEPIAERDLPPGPSRVAMAPDEGSVATITRMPEGDGTLVKIASLADGQAGPSVTVPPQVDGAVWTGSDRLLVVGRSEGRPWAEMVYPGLREIHAPRLATGSASRDADLRPATTIALEHVPSKSVSRVFCSSNGLIAVLSSRGTFPLVGDEVYEREGELNHVIDLLRVGGEVPGRATHQVQFTCPFLVPDPALARDGWHLLLSQMLGDASVVRLDEVEEDDGAYRRRYASGAQKLLADGDCVIGERVVGQQVMAWRSTPDELLPWANWEPSGAFVDVVDVVVRGVRADVLVRDRNGTLLVFRLPDPDLLDLDNERAERRRRALRSLAERRDPETTEALSALLDEDAFGDRPAVVRALVAIGGNALDAVVDRLWALPDGELDPLFDTLETAPVADLEAAARRCWAAGAEASKGAVRLLHRRRDLDGAGILAGALRTGDPALAALAADALDVATAPDAIIDLIAAAGSPDHDLAEAAGRAVRRYLVEVGVGGSDADIDVLSADTPEVEAILEAGRASADEPSLLAALADALVRPRRSGADVLNALDALAAAETRRATALVLAILMSARLSQSQPAVAARLLERAIEWSEPADLDLPAVHWRAQLDRARLSSLAQSAPEDRAARAWLRAAMSSVDRSWSQLLGDPANPHFFAEKAELYDEAMLNELRLGDPAAALDVLERAKTRYLVDLIARRHDPRVRTLEPIDQLFWQVVGAAQPSPGRRVRTPGSVSGPSLGVVSTSVKPSPEAPLPEMLAALRTESNALGGSMIEALWRLIATFPDEPAEQVTRAKEVFELLDATLARAPAAAHGEGTVNAADVRGGYLRAARDLLAIDHDYWALNEFGDRWLRAYLEDPDGLERHTLAALREAIAYVTGREPVALIAPPGAAAEAGYASAPDAALVFEPAPPGTHMPAPATTPSPPPAERLRLSSRRRWEEIERFARGETAGFREAAQLVLEEPGFALIQFAVTPAGTAIFLAADGAALGRGGLPPLAGWGEPAVFTSAEITSQWLADALAGHTRTSWMTTYLRRDEDRQRWEEQTDALLAKLHAELFAAPRDWLRERSVRRLLVVPHRGLHQLPLGAWFSPTRRGRRYVIDEFDVCGSPSVSLREVCARRAPEGDMVDRVLIVAPPAKGLALSGVDALALPGDATILDGEHASTDEWASAAGGAALCHYQGHAAYRWEQPLESELILAGPPLTLGDLFDDALEMPHAQAVTLSGCETTMTALDPADEWLGLAAGFMFAGAPAVLSTHWAVTELAASMLVDRYYRELRAGRRPSAALAIAQRWLRGEVTKRTCRSFLERVTKSAGGRQRDTVERILSGLPGTPSRPFAAPAYWGAYSVVGLDRALRWTRGAAS